MPGIDQCHQPCAVDVGVNLRGNDIGVAEQSLQYAKVRPAFQQMRSKGMAQDMRAELGGIETGARGKIAQHLE